MQLAAIISFSKPDQLESDMKACNLKVLDGRHPKALKLEIHLDSMSQASLLLLMMAVPAVSGTEMVVHASAAVAGSTGSGYDIGFPMCVLMLIGIFATQFQAYRFGVARGRYFG